MATGAHFEPLKQSKYPLPENLKAACGFLTVPESRNTASGNFPGSRTLRIYVTVVKSLNENPRPDPIVLLYGGPGGNSAGILDALGDPQVQDMLLGQRDFIVFDHRGTGFSQPALFAPEVDPLWSDAFLRDFDIDERAERFVNAMLRARDRFLGADINLAAVNTPEIAADLEDLRTVLGYAKINLWGVSYGTRVALAALRDCPEGIRSVILDSTVPIQVSQYVEAIPNAHHTFNHLFDAVAADPRTHAAYPNLREVFYDVFERLNKTPVVMPAKHPVKKTAIKLRLTGEVFIGILCLDFYSGDAIAKMPDRIYRVYRGDHQELAAALIRWLDRPASDLPGRSQGMYYCVNCCDDKVSAQTAEQIIKYSQQYPELSSLALTEFALAVRGKEFEAGGLEGWEGAYGTQLSISDKHASSGGKSLRADLPPGQYPGIGLTLRGAKKDWSACQALRFSAYNASGGELKICVRIDDDASRDFGTRYNNDMYPHRLRPGANRVEVTVAALRQGSFLARGLDVSRIRLITALNRSTTSGERMFISSS